MAAGQRVNIGRDWETKEIYRRTAKQLQLIGTALADEPLTSPHLAGFILSVADLFAEVDPEA